MELGDMQGTHYRVNYQPNGYYVKEKQFDGDSGVTYSMHTTVPEHIQNIWDRASDDAIKAMKTHQNLYEMR
ncbi:hypothetical protein JCM19241_1069 [Vibrio ishigakensis]|uniref:Uncharacterized protein n=1 Tax=Vibrio ishigakensis TaxID=1481914 RepID=A0A0B8Q7Z4_9VIBR|nr:hypothetical protein JCM19241_1069 [Vibrio ishigakensis]